MLLPAQHLSSSEQDCEVCYVKHGRETLQLPCGHVYCSHCLNKHCRAALKRTVRISASCCRHEIPVEAAVPLLDLAIQTRAQDQMKEIQTKRKLYCARCARFICKRSISEGVGHCRTCNAKRNIKTCFQCRSLVDREHKLPCTLPEDDPSELLALTAEMNWCRCPKCDQMIEKDGGCRHMM